MDAYKSATNWAYFSSYFSSIESLSPNLITFTVDEVEYQAKEGVAWSDWLKSEYNIDDWYYAGEEIISSDHFFKVDNVKADDLIINGHAYITAFNWVPA